jgi:hypothetical protein
MKQVNIHLHPSAAPVFTPEKVGRASSLSSPEEADRQDACPTLPNDALHLCLGNDAALDAEGWCLIAPFGEWPKTRLYRDAGGVREQQYIQVLDHASADAMVSRENSFFGRLKRAFVGVPVYKGHGDLNDVDPAALSHDAQKIKLGVVDQIRKGARGLEAHFALDNDGAEAVRAGFKFPSGFWYVRPLGDEGPGSGVSGLGSQTPAPGRQTRNPRPQAPIRCRPFKLISVALTTHPNISGVESLANGRSPTSHSEPNPIDSENMKLITGWLLARGIAPANSENPTETQVLEAIQRLHTSTTADVTALGNEKQTLSGALTALTGERDTLRRRQEETTTALANEQTARAAERRGRAELAVDLALQRGQLTVARREAQLAALVNSADFDAAAQSLLTGPTVIRLAGQNTESGKQGAALSDATLALQNEYHQAFQTEMLATGHDPVKAHKNVMTLPKYAALAEMLMPAKF